MTIGSVGRVLRMAVAILLGVQAVRQPAVARAEATSWSVPIQIPDTPADSWFPDLAVDSRGLVHIVWCETESGTKGERVLYTTWDGATWGKPNDVIWPSQRIHRNALAIDPADNLLLVFRDERVGGTDVYFASAPAANAWSAAAWSEPQRLSAYRGSYATDIGVDERGSFHVLFDDTGARTGTVCPGGCADIYYRNSDSQGKTWSAPQNLSQSVLGCSREQLEIEATGVLHAAWDEGWDRLSGAGSPLYSVYRGSPDGGVSWSAPVTVTYPTTGTVQLAPGADGKGGVMLVWCNTAHDEIFHQWSNDYGRHWSAPEPIPGILARPWTIPFDLYDMATDSAGVIHLLAVGRLSPERDAPLALYCLAWDFRNTPDSTSATAIDSMPHGLYVTTCGNTLTIRSGIAAPCLPHPE